MPEDAFIQEEKPSEELAGTARHTGILVYEFRDAEGNYTYLAGPPNREREEIFLGHVVWMRDR